MMLTRDELNAKSRESIHAQFAGIVKTAAFNLGKDVEFRSEVVKVLVEYKRTKKLSLIAGAAKAAMGDEWYRTAYAEISDPQLFEGLEWTVKRIEAGGFDG